MSEINDKPGSSPTFTKSILCVENSRVFTGYYANECKSRGLKSVIATDVADALAKIQETKPQAVLCSGHFRGLPGVSLVSALKCSFFHRAIPVALVTATDNNVDFDVAYHADAVLERSSIREHLPAFLDELGLTAKRTISVADEQLIHGKRFLLAEDSSVVQMLVGKMLHVAGAEVVVVGNGEEALQTVDDSFDMILLDIEMPEVDGLEAMSEMRNRGIKKPILALTAHQKATFIAEALDLGFDEVLHKPLTPSNLISRCAQRFRMAT